MGDGTTVKVLWRYSLGTPTWRAGHSTSVDFSTMVMGYALNYLPQNFYPTYAAGGTGSATTTTQAMHSNDLTFDIKFFI